MKEKMIKKSIITIINEKIKEFEVDTGMDVVEINLPRNFKREFIIEKLNMFGSLYENDKNFERRFEDIIEKAELFSNNDHIYLHHLYIRLNFKDIDNDIIFINGKRYEL